MIRALAASLIVLPAAAAAQTCTPVTFADNFTAGTIEGVAPAEGATCYMLDMSGHDGNLALEIEGQNVAFAYGVGDLAGEDMTSVQMFPASNAVQVNVSQRSGDGSEQPFRLNIEAMPPG